MNLTTGVVLGLGFVIGYVKPIAKVLAMSPPAVSYIGILVALLLGYVVLAQGVKMLYKKVFHTWL